MRAKWVCAGLALIATQLVSQEKSVAVFVNGADAKWTHDAGDPAGSEGIVLRGDGKTGMELMVRFPGGHTFPPHWHDSNERIIVLEGELSVGKGSAMKTLDPGGYAFLPAKEVQYLSCASSSRCAFYLAWDGSPASHKAAVDPQH